YRVHSAGRAQPRRVQGPGPRRGRGRIARRCSGRRRGRCVLRGHGDGPLRPGRAGHVRAVDSDRGHRRGGRNRRSSPRLAGHGRADHGPSSALRQTLRRSAFRAHRGRRDLCRRGQVWGLPRTGAGLRLMEVGGIQALRRWRARQSGRVGLVPTMGALHSGHQALMTRARAESDLVVTSIFVNPLQFGADEDFVQYPRPIASDLAKCEEAGVDFVFAPALGEMYPSAPEVRVVAGRMGAVFEGEARPGHFDGVLTVVAKLFNLIEPDVTVFGLKDIQQFCLVKRMIADLDFDIEIIGLPVVRDADGLAMSSRNEYLSPSDRERALTIPRALDAAAEVAAGRAPEGADPGASALRGAASGRAASGETVTRRAASGETAIGSVADGVLPESIESAARAVLEPAAERGELDIIYLSLVDASTLRPCPADFRGSALLLVSATVGGTHLIDNLPLEF